MGTWDRALDRVGELASLDRERQIFASFSHHYRFGMKLWEAAIRSYEERIGIELPAEYRAFLIEAGDGGPGPYYGILTFEKAIAETPTELIASPFVLERDLDFYREYAGETPYAEHALRWKEDAEYRQHCDDVVGRLNQPALVAGTITICHFGCGDRFRLVVSGDRRGEIWVDSTHSGTGLFELKVTMRGFYERWLDDAFARIAAQDFEPGPGYFELGARL